MKRIHRPSALAMDYETLGSPNQARFYREAAHALDPYLSLEPNRPIALILS